MKFTHFLYVPFTGLGLFKGYRGDTWLKNRIMIFNQFVLPSILNQTVQNFIVWFSWRPEEETNEIVQQFKRSLEKVREFNFVFTFGGLCFYDDKYDDVTAKQRLLTSLEKVLPSLAPFVENSEEVYMTLQPSDDMYVARAVEFTQEFFENHKEEVMGFSRGYIMQYETKEIAEYDPLTTPPFYTIRFSKYVFLDPKSHINFIGPYKSHEFVKDFLFSHYVQERGFVVGTHAENISTHWDHPFQGRMLDSQERESVLMETGNYFTESLVVTKDNYRKWMKRIINMLPPFLQRKIICFLSSSNVCESIKNYYWFNL